MGSSGSKPEVPDPLLETPWRKVNWSEKQDLLTMVKNFKPSTEAVPLARILLYGPVGAGKSSFINSVTTAVLGRSFIGAGVNTTSGKSYTLQYKTHRIKNEATQQYYPFVFNDIMGLESGDDVGVRAEDIKLALLGHVRDGYTFNPCSPLSEGNTHYNSSPSAEDRVHLLVCVLSANSPQIKPSVLQKMKEVRETARDLGIPQIAVATHIDSICEEVDRDVKNVFRSKWLKQKMSEFSSLVGIPMNSIFPLKNYCEDVDNEEDMDTLILGALKHMLDYADDFLDSL